MLKLNNHVIYCLDQDDAAFKKPLFSEDEDEDEDDVLSDDGKAEQWRKDRFKRESYLSLVLNKCINF